MKSTITVRDVDPGDKSWLKREARQVGVSMEEFVRRLIREKREQSRRRLEAFRGIQTVFPDRNNGIELPPPPRYPYRPVEFSDERKA